MGYYSCPFFKSIPMTTLMQKAQELPTVKTGKVWELFSMILQEVLVFFDRNFTDSEGKFNVPKLYNPVFIYRAIILVKRIMELIAEYKKQNEPVKA